MDKELWEISIQFAAIEAEGNGFKVEAAFTDPDKFPQLVTSKGNQIYHLHVLSGIYPECPEPNRQKAMVFLEHAKKLNATPLLCRLSLVNPEAQSESELGVLPATGAISAKILDFGVLAYGDQINTSLMSEHPERSARESLLSRVSRFFKKT